MHACDFVENASRENIPRLFSFLSPFPLLSLSLSPSIRSSVHLDITPVLPSVHLRLRHKNEYISRCSRRLDVDCRRRCIRTAAVSIFRRSCARVLAACTLFRRKLRGIPAVEMRRGARRVDGTAEGTGERARAGMHVSLVTLRPAHAGDAMAVHTGGAGTGCIHR